MGKTARWLKGLFGLKKESESERDSSVETSSSSDNRKDRKIWSFGRSGKDNSGVIPPQIPEVNLGGRVKDAACLRYMSESEREQNKHAIAVAAATAAAADAAVAAAQAAVAVVRLTSHGRGTSFGGGRERWASVKIQTLFRGYLARKALRALKGLVKIQALVRGYLVRKQAAATLQSMQALIRAQNAARSQRARRYFNKENRYPENRSRLSIGRFDDVRSEFHSKRLSASYDLGVLDENPKIVEIDTFKPLSRSRRINTALSECSEDFPYHNMSSPLPCPIPTRISIPDCKNQQDLEWYFTGEECRFATAHNTPRFANYIRSNTPATPAKSVCGDGYFRPYSNFPSYMANTQSFNAKLRSHSTPKQRPDPAQKKRLSLNEMMAARNSISSVKMQWTSDHIDEELEPQRNDLFAETLATSTVVDRTKEL